MKGTSGNPGVGYRHSLLLKTVVQSVSIWGRIAPVWCLSHSHCALFFLPTTLLKVILSGGGGSDSIASNKTINMHISQHKHTCREEPAYALAEHIRHCPRDYWYKLDFVYWSKNVSVVLWPITNTKWLDSIVGLYGAFYLCFQKTWSFFKLRRCRERDSKWNFKTSISTVISIS